MNYDIIGDIHGHHGSLEALLRKMGYREKGGCWRKPGHTAIFVGDLIDRGPGQLETVNLVRSMVESGAALVAMGNHEFNALAWDTPDPEQPGAYLRPHSDKNLRQHAAFLAATEGYPARRKEILDWFWTLPLWLDLPELRVVHACWDPGAMTDLKDPKDLKPRLAPDNRLTQPLLEAACRRGSRAHAAVETVLKGPEVQLPDGMQFPQGDTMRSEARTRWWDASAISLKDSAIVDEATRSSLPDHPVPAELRAGYAGEQPVFIGHYWMKGEPRLLQTRVACVDYSAGGGMPLVAYRWQGENDLRQEHFLSAI